MAGGRVFRASPSAHVGRRTVLVRCLMAGWGMISSSCAKMNRLQRIVGIGLALTGLIAAHDGGRLVAASPTSAAGADNASWVVANSVTYQANHDPRVIWLADGRRLQVVFGQVRWEEVEAWEAGRPLLLVFHQKRGTLLVDPATRGELPVIGGLGERHPLDELLAKELDDENSTAGLVDAYRRNAARWEGEIDRIYGVVAAARIPPELASKFQASRAAWHEGRRTHVEAASTLSALAGGTIWQIESAARAQVLARNHALWLTTLLADLH